MNTDSYTDEQLLNLVHNTIQQKTKYDIYDFTGGGVTLTNTYGGKQQSYKVSLFFGFNKSKNPIKTTIDIKEDFVYLWLKAIQTKLLTMRVSDTGMDFNELNKLLNEPAIIDNNKIDNIIDNIIGPLRSRYEGSTVLIPNGIPTVVNFNLKIGSMLYDCVSFKEIEDRKIAVEYKSATGDITGLKLDTKLFLDSFSLKD